MISHFFKSSIAQLSKNLGYSILNVVTLSCGFIFGLFLISYSLYQSSFDRFHANSENSFLLQMVYLPSQGVSTIYLPPPPILYEHLQNISGVNQATRVYQNTISHIRKFKTHEIVSGGNMIRVDSAFNNIFNFKLDNKSWLEMINHPNSILISNSLAQRLDYDSIIENFIYVDTIQYKIVGVFKDTPSNSSLQFDLVTSTTGYDSLSWYARESPLIYCSLNSHISIDKIEQLLEQKLKAENGNNFSLSNVSLKNQYFESQLLSIRGDSFRTNLFIGLGLLIILISILNYISSYITIISKRIKEIGVRLILGSNHYQLVAQCIADALIILVIVLVFSIGTLLFFDSQFALLIDGSGSAFFNMISWIEFLIWLFLITLFSLSIIALYPFIIIRNLHPTSILRGDNDNTIFSGKFRVALIAFQFMASIILIDYTAFIYSQSRYLENLPLGFNKSDKIFGAFDETFRNKGIELEPALNSFKNEVKALSSVQGVSVNPIPTQYDMLSISIDSIKQLNFYIHSIDIDFINVMGIQLLTGQDFNNDNSSSSLIINEKAASLLFPNSSAVGETISEFPGYQIIGVVKNFYFKGFKSGVGPLIMRADNYSPTNLHIKCMDFKKCLSEVIPLWQKHFPDYPMEFGRLEGAYDDLYLKSQKSEMDLIFLAAIVSLLLSSLGVFGLVSFHIRNRKKEMSIRTILGANPLQIFTLYSKPFILVIALTTIISIPIVYHISSSYLDNYAVKADISFFTFLIGVFSILLITILTVLIQFLRELKENSAKYLRV